MNIKRMLYMSLLWNLSLAYSMESAKSNSNEISDANLQKIIMYTNGSSLYLVDFFKNLIRINNIPFNLETIKSIFNLQQSNLNEIFLNTIEDEALRPLILSAGADINALSQEKYNCLWYTQKPELLARLIDLGANVNHIDSKGGSCLTNLLPLLDETTLKAARILLEKGANPNVIFDASLNRSLLHQLVKQACINKKFINAIQLLCEHKANSNIQDTFNETPLMTAVQDSNVEVVKVLLDHGADPNIGKESTNEYPIHMAIKAGYYGQHKYTPEIAILLLKHSANPNVSYPNCNNTPLNVAIECQQTDIIQALINSGADKHHRNYTTRTPLEIALQYPYYQKLPNIIDLLSDNKVDHTEPNEITEFTILNFNNQKAVDSRNNRTCYLQ